MRLAGESCLGAVIKITLNHCKVIPVSNLRMLQVTLNFEAFNFLHFNIPPTHFIVPSGCWKCCTLWMLLSKPVIMLDCYWSVGYGAHRSTWSKVRGSSVQQWQIKNVYSPVSSSLYGVGEYSFKSFFFSFVKPNAFKIYTNWMIFSKQKP